jgi:hypothetical protein
LFKWFLHSVNLFADPFTNLWRKEEAWLQHVETQLLDSAEPVSEITWAAYHSSKAPLNNVPPALCSLLPLFHESSTSPSMMRHAMDLVKSNTEYLNPGQTPVLCGDQPCYALAKHIQLLYGDLYGESSFFIMFAPFHIEQNFLRVIGQIMEDSGWTRVVARSEVMTEGAADAILKVCAQKRDEI